MSDVRSFQAVTLALTAALVLPTSNASAAGTSDTLVVSVTVAPSCSITSQPVDLQLSSVSLSCSSAHRLPVLMGSTLNDGHLASPGRLAHVSTKSEANPSVVRTVTLNF
jgi:hypothetical protein